MPSSDSSDVDSGSEYSFTDSSDSGSSSGDEIEGIVPYRFEPEAGSDEEEVEEVVVDNLRQERLENNFWCSCSGDCAPMPIVRECVCCKEIPEVVHKMDSFNGGELDCITNHPGFEGVCLNPWVLETAYFHYRQQYGGGGRNDATENEKNRHVAYRQLARWCWGFLGRAVRVPLPSCAVRVIRDTFPSEVYRGFQEL
ncbi:uncharacterized protein LOC129278654 [Lytechinus pictus]|uniref:uncharacterized protein LOC129278654 n=1 Tax=Lytechinus pictus TaxID=7653 RepID=UPI00240D2D44|nr:uncharacterized protein LOC129259891 [Lytechinus pictus]